MNNNNGEDLVTPTGSQPETITTEPTGAVNPQGAEVTGSPEEVEFNSLKGGTQQRIKDILHERDQIRVEADRYKAYIGGMQQQPQAFNQQPQQNLDLSNPQVRDAVSQLDKVGVATKDWAAQQINSTLGQYIYNAELGRLEDKLDGSNGAPKFDKSEYTDFVQRNPKYQNYEPEDVYNIMYSEELMDAKLKERGIQPQTGNTSLRPNRTQVREEQWTPEAIQQRMSEPDAKQWYVANRDMINKVLQSQTPQQ